ncbi:MAG: hypothetical protein LBP80_07255 [Treponema sp.]|jgi:hypothetical protein|nr:hypothetical protein [Treponema sp.]
MDETKKLERRLEYPLPRETAVYPRRSMVNYQGFQDRVKNRYWVCGTSLNAIREYVLTDVLRNNVEDFKILFPDFHETAPAYTQLREYQKRPEQVYGDVVENIKSTYRDIGKMLQGKQLKVSDHLRLYPGIMFQNITIFDDEAFVSFYDATGNGPDNITIYCTGAKDKALYDRLLWLFSDMWKVSE